MPPPHSVRDVMTRTVVGVVSEADLLPKEGFRDSVRDRVAQLRRPDDLAKAGALTAGKPMSAPAVTVHTGTALPEASCRCSCAPTWTSPRRYAGRSRTTGSASRAPTAPRSARPVRTGRASVRRRLPSLRQPFRTGMVRVPVFSSGTGTVMVRTPSL